MPVYSGHPQGEQNLQFVVQKMESISPGSPAPLLAVKAEFSQLPKPFEAWKWFGATFLQTYQDRYLIGKVLWLLSLSVSVIPLSSSASL
jgi:hypothetical protein